MIGFAPPVSPTMTMNQLRDSTQASLIFNLWVRDSRNTVGLPHSNQSLRRSQALFDIAYNQFFNTVTGARVEYPLTVS